MKVVNNFPSTIGENVAVDKYFSVTYARFASSLQGLAISEYRFEEEKRIRQPYFLFEV